MWNSVKGKKCIESRFGHSFRMVTKGQNLQALRKDVHLKICIQTKILELRFRSAGM